MGEGSTILWQYIAMGFYMINLILVIYASLEMIFRKSEPIKTVSWIIVLIALPYVGIILYLLVGQNFRKKKIYSRKGVKDERIRRNISSEQGHLYMTKPESLPGQLHEYKKLILQNLKSSHSILARNDEIDVFFSGKEALEAMLESISNAKDHVHLQSYIIENDNIGNRYKDMLIKKASEGVLVRLIYDDVGCWSLPNSFLKELEEAGIEVLRFSPVNIILPQSKINYRNHRKILVVDGAVGYIGGVNIADRYCDGGYFEEWRDTHIRIRGESVFSLQASFLLDRYFIKNHHLRSRKRYYPEIQAIKPQVMKTDSHIYAQVISSGPDSDWASIMQMYFTAITEARESIKIVSPYFTPGESILNALKIAALAGVDVKLMIPEKTDSKITGWSSKSYITELMEAGIKVYLFEHGFNHSKVVSIDRRFCIIGSANMDNRSMEYNFEISAIIYDRRIAGKIEDRFNDDIGRCRFITKGEWKNRPWQDKAIESIARLVSPLL